MKFMIYSSARSGSTTLMNILNTHYQICCLNEPFNPDHQPPMDVAQVGDFTILQTQLQRWLEEYNGIKHVWDPKGWPFMNRADFNQRLLLEFDRVIFLNRRNALQRVVSSQLSLQSQVWHIRSKADEEKHRGFTFSTLDLGAIGKQLENERKTLALYAEFLKANRVNYFQLWYEDIFSSTVSLPEKVSIINRLYTFLGVKEIDSNPISSQMAQYLSTCLVIIMVVVYHFKYLVLMTACRFTITANVINHSLSPCQLRKGYVVRQGRLWVNGRLMVVLCSFDVIINQ